MKRLKEIGNEWMNKARFEATRFFQKRSISDSFQQLFPCKCFPKISYKYFYGLFLFLLIFTTPIYAEIDINKVYNYLNTVETVLTKYPDVFKKGENSPEGKELMSIFDAYKLTDDEVLEALNILTKDQDVDKIANTWASGSTKVPYDKDIAMKYAIFTLTVGNFQESKWKNLSAEEILMNKILPILSKIKNLAVIRYYLIESGGLFRDITNKKLTISNENRAKFSDKYIEIFKNDNNSIEIRSLAVEGWTIAEKRSEKQFENLDIIIKNEDLFEFTANYLRHITVRELNQKKMSRKSNLRSNDQYEEPILNKMLYILENSESYSPKIINGVLSYFIRITEDLSLDSRKRLNEILKNKIDNEKNQELKEKYNHIYKKIK